MQQAMLVKTSTGYVYKPFLLQQYGTLPANSNVQERAAEYQFPTSWATTEFVAGAAVVALGIRSNRRRSRFQNGFQSSTIRSAFRRVKRVKSGKSKGDSGEEPDDPSKDPFVSEDPMADDSDMSFEEKDKDSLWSDEDDQGWNSDFDLSSFRFDEDKAINGKLDKEDNWPSLGQDNWSDDDDDVPVPTEQELSLLYDDFEVDARASSKKRSKPRGNPDLPEEDANSSSIQKETATQIRRKRSGRILESLEEREYVVTAEGVAVRTLPDERSPRTGEILRQGEKFTAIEAVDGVDRDQRLYLRLPDGRGWVFDDEKIYPGLPSVRLVSVGGMQVKEVEPEAVKRPLIAVLGRPNVGKSTLVNRMSEVPDATGNITFDEGGSTRDRVYKASEHTDDNGDTYLLDVVDTGGLIFEDNPEVVTFNKEIKLQIDVALREAVAAILVVDSQTGLQEEDMQIARYLKKVYMPLGLKVVVAVAKSDRLETMDYKAAEFWSLDLGEPIPISAIHGRGVWEVMDKIVNRGCNGLFPMRLKGQDAPPAPRDKAISVAICGKPNAGKSSLLNALVGENRSIVSDIPGTTTDSIDAYLETEQGKVYRFVDTAGMRKHARIEPGTEWLAVNRTLKAVNRADVALLLLDSSEVMAGTGAKGNAFWCPDSQMRYIARQIESRGTACVIVLTKWDALLQKDAKTAQGFVQAIRSNLVGVGQWAEVVTVSAKTGQRLTKLLEVIDKTLEAHRKRVPTPVLNEVVRDALLWRLPAAKAYNQKQGRIYYATQVASEPPQITLFCNNPKLFGNNYKTYLENKLRQDLAWFGTPIQLEWRKRAERRAVAKAEQWLGPRLQPSEAWR